METSNAKEIREALEKALVFVQAATFDVIHNGVVYEHTKVIADVQTALAAPPRNCDVGTVEEQAKRFWRFCNEKDCDECPLPSIKGGSCEFFWGQMPYEMVQAGADNGSK